MKLRRRHLLAAGSATLLAGAHLGAALVALRAGQHAMALDRARANWAIQHEVEDAQLLIDAAVAAGKPEEARPVLDWIADEGLAIPALRIPEAVAAAAR